MGQGHVYQCMTPPLLLTAQSVSAYKLRRTVVGFLVEERSHSSQLKDSSWSLLSSLLYFGFIMYQMFSFGEKFGQFSENLYNVVMLL